MNSDDPRHPGERRFEERLLAAILADYDNIVHARSYAGVLPERRHRRTLAVTTLAVVGGGAALAASLAAGGGGGGSRLDAALVVKRVEVAIKNAVAAGYIDYDHTAMTDCGQLQYTVKDWFSSSERRAQVFTPNGTLVSEEWDGGARTGASSMLQVVYAPKLYYEGPMPAGYLDRPGRLDGGYTQLNQQIAAGEFTVSGPTTVDGTSTYELTEIFPNGSVTDIWVNSTTFFLVRWANTNSGFVQSWDVSWLKPSATNLAYLAEPTVPAGFTRVQQRWFPLPTDPAVSAATTTVPATSTPAATTTVPGCASAQ